MNVNITIIAGHLTRDPELRYLPSGSALAQFTLALNRKWKDDAGAEKEEVSFIDCVVFGRTAETLSKYCAKGAPLFVEGRLKQETWDDKATGQKRSKLKVVVERFSFVGRKGDAPDKPAAAPESEPEPSRPRQGVPPKEPRPAEEDDVPF